MSHQKESTPLLLRVRAKPRFTILAYSMLEPSPEVKEELMKAGQSKMKDELRHEYDLGQLLKRGYAPSTRSATTRVQISFSSTPMSERPFAAREPLTTPYAW
jgi:hypothetical protein